jgi:hypothetical protein
MCVWTLSLPLVVSSFNLVFMAKRGRKGGLQRNLDDEGSTGRAPKSSRSVNQGRGQEITGVTLPAEGSLKGWEFGDGVQMACANVGGNFFAIQVGRSCVVLRYTKLQAIPMLERSMPLTHTTLPHVDNNH